MIDFLTGPFGAFVFYGAGAGFFGLSQQIRRAGQIIVLVLLTPVVLWFPLFYGSAL